MKFLGRSIIAIFLLSITVILLILAAGQIMSALKDAQSSDRPSRPQRERVYAASVDTLQVQSITPEIVVFGRVESWRSTELRAVVSGELVSVSPDFRDGRTVREGQIVFQIDPSKSSSALSLAETEEREAQAELTDAMAAIELAREEVEIAQTQLEIRSQSLQRQEDLKLRGVGTDSEIENAALALSSSEQALVNQKQALAQADIRVARAEIALDRREISVAEAERLLSETKVIAPFDGVISDVTGILGKMVSANEKLGDLIDPSALEVAFRVSNAQFSRIVDATGNLKPLPINVRFDLDDLPFAISATIDRSSAEVGDGQTGRLIYARLHGPELSILRPGDFLTVVIQEDVIENTTIVPATAINDKSQLMLVGENDRLETYDAEVVRRLGEIVILANAPIGRTFVTELTPQIGQGIQIRPLRAENAPESVQTPAVDSGAEMIVLSPDRKEKLLAFVEGNTRMPEEAKARIIAQINGPEISKEAVERLESRMGR